jgi:hypothetical protein
MFSPAAECGPRGPIPRESVRTRPALWVPASTRCPDRTGPDEGPFPRECPDLTCPGPSSTSRFRRFSKLAKDLRSVPRCPVPGHRIPSGLFPNSDRTRPHLSPIKCPDRRPGPGKRGRPGPPSRSGQVSGPRESGPMSPDRSLQTIVAVAGHFVLRGTRSQRCAPPARSRTAVAQRLQTSFCHKRPNHQDQISTWSMARATNGDVSTSAAGGEFGARVAVRVSG